MKNTLPVIYIVAWGRSGSTLLDLALGGVDGFSSLGEFSAIWDAGWKDSIPCGCGKPIPDCETWSRVLERAGNGSIDPHWMAQARWRLSRERYTFRLLRLATRNPTKLPSDLRTYVDTMRDLYHAAADEMDAEVLIDSSKVPSDAAMLRLMDGIEPYFLHLVRDPRATAYSWTKERAQPTTDGERLMPRYGPTYSSLRWLARNLEAEALTRIAGSPRSTRVRYEDFVSRPGATVATAVNAVSAVTDLPFEGQDLVLTDRSHTVAGNPGRFHSSRIPIREAEEWREHMNTARKMQIALLTLPLFLRYGYASR